MKTIKKTINGIQAGDKIRYLDGDTHIYTVLAVYFPTKISVGLRDFPDTEQDYLTDIKEVEKV